MISRLAGMFLHNRPGVLILAQTRKDLRLILHQISVVDVLT